MDKITKQLISLSEEKYRLFQEKLVPDNKYEILGIRIPILRNFSRRISEVPMFINENPFVFSHGSTICQQVAVNGCITEHDSIFVEVIPRPSNFFPFILRNFSKNLHKTPLFSTST